MTAKLGCNGTQMNHAGLAKYNFHIHYKAGKSNVGADALSRIDWEKCDKIIQADSIQAYSCHAAITGHGTCHIEAIPCNPQAIESIPPSIPDDTLIVNKAITRSSGQSHMTHPETKSFISETESKLDDSSHPGG